MLKISAVGVAVAALLATAPAARAGEAGFLARLAVDYDMTITEADQAEVLDAGYMVCDFLREGMPNETAAANIIRHSNFGTIAQAEGFVFAAQRELCPDTAE